MFRTALALLLVALALPVRAADDPRALVARAVEAQGGMACVEATRVTRARLKGILHDLEGTPRFTAELIKQLPGQYRLSLEVDLTGQVLTTTQVLNGTRGWLRDDMETKEASPEGLREMQESAYVDYVSTLAPLLEKDRFQLSAVDMRPVQGRPVHGVLVKAAGRPDVKLAFDRESGLLVKVENRRFDPEKKQDVLHEEYLSDYREVDLTASDRQALQAAGVGSEPAAVLAFVRRLVVDEAQRERIKALIRKLGDPDFQTREKAKKDLAAEGEPAAGLLNQAAADPDPEVASRARELLKQIGKTQGQPDAAVQAAAVRLLAYHKPAGAAAALLAYLPAAPTEQVADEVRAALAAVARVDGKPDPALEKAQEDANPQRRAAARAALEREGVPGQRLYVSGLKSPARGVVHFDGKKGLEWELVELQLFNRLSDRLFGKPGE